MTGHSLPWREFGFPPTTPLHAAMPVIVAALADEGLKIADGTNSPGDRIGSVIVNGLKIVRVPLTRIAPIA